MTSMNQFEPDLKRQNKVDNSLKVALDIKRIWAYETGLSAGVGYKVISKNS